MPPRIGQIIGALLALLEGRPTETITVIEGLVASGFRDPEGLYYLGRQLAHAGAIAQAAEVLELATAAGFFCHPLFAFDDWLDPLRDLPAFAPVLSRVEREHNLAVDAFTAAGGDQILGRD